MPETATVRPLPVGDLRGIVVDTEELAKGARLLDEQGLTHLARHENRLYAEARGSGPAPYRVSLQFSDSSPDVWARCTCMAARTRPFCKHAAGLLVAWSRIPEAFAVSEAPPARATAKRAVKKGATQTKELMRAGVAQVETLVRELAVAGIAAVGLDRVQQVRELGERLRENKLRRLSARTLDLALLLDATAARTGELPAGACAELLSDLLLTARKLARHLDGEPLDDRHVEELVGKTWKEADCARVEGLRLVEYAYASRVTSDDYVIRESRYLDLASGGHYSEKQIVPRMMARAAEVKVSRAGAALEGVRGGVYPGYPPHRIKITDLGHPRPAGAEALGAIRDRALPDLGAALAALQQHRRDVFAPDLVPVAVRVDTLLARGSRTLAVDAQGNALHLPEDPDVEELVGAALGEARLAVLLGDLGIEAALPTLFPLALLVEGPLGLELRTVAGSAPRRARAEPAAHWSAAAREAGASPAAIALGEVREELAEALARGLAGLGDRATEPLAARLGDLGLDKQAALLRALPGKAEAERLDDFVKLHQVLGIALLRLAGAARVDRSELTAVPGHESVLVPTPVEALDARRVALGRAAGTLNRFDAAVHAARRYEALPVGELTAPGARAWADGTAGPALLRAFAGRPHEAVEAARKVLGAEEGTVPRRAAVQVLGAAAAGAEPGAGEAMEALRALAGEAAAPPATRRLAADALDALALQGAAEQGAHARHEVQTRRDATLAAVASVAADLVSAPYKEERLAAALQLGELGDRSALPVLRRAFLADAARAVREAAGLVLAQLADAEMLDRFVALLARRAEDPAEGRLGAALLGHLGDVRGLEELLAARAEKFRPAVVAAALRTFGVTAAKGSAR